MEIINSIEDFLTENKARVLLMSEDRAFIDRAEGITNLIPLLVKYPPKKDSMHSYTVTWNDLTELLFSSAVYFGSVILGGGSSNGKRRSLCAIQGVWLGKTHDDWRVNHLKVWDLSEILIGAKKNLHLIQ